MWWDRWRRWKRGDSRWDVVTLDTTLASIDETVEVLSRWIADKRLQHRDATLPL